MSYISDEKFGQIVDFESVRMTLQQMYDAVEPELNLLNVCNIMADAFGESPSHMVTAGASVLAYMMLPAVGEHDLAMTLKDNIFSLGWTEEQCGTDLLSIRTQATPLDTGEKDYYLTGSKWMINNSFHADYHCVLAKLDPENRGARSLSLFLVPRSSTRNWERLETHVLTDMVLTKYEIDGPGILLGKIGEGLSSVQQLALASRYLCTFIGVQMLQRAVPATIDWLATKRIFEQHPIDFTNVFRQLHDLSLQTALWQFMYYRAYALGTDAQMQFHGTILKSFLLLQINKTLSQNLLVAGSKGFVDDNIIGQYLIDSFVLPVFDGHYTLNTFLTAKHAKRYMNPTQLISADAHIEYLRSHMYQPECHDELGIKQALMRKSEFFDRLDYVSQFDLPITIPFEMVENKVTEILDAMRYKFESAHNPDYKYKVGLLIHWLESLFAAVDLWAVTENDEYLNIIIMQYNGLVGVINNIISEYALPVGYILPLRKRPLPDVEDKHAYLMNLINVNQYFEHFELVH